jgi:hypothetical protein
VGKIVNNKSVYLSIRKADIGKIAVPRLVHKYLVDIGLLA